jgi:putative cardiolipin synthase
VTEETHFGRLAAGWADIHDDKSGFFPLGQGMDALGARLRLLEKSEKSADLQYFLMKDDTAGRVILHALLQAADRGVRVRFLLDDIFTEAPDRNLLLIDQHPNIEVRLFNPISRRGLHWLNFVGNFRQANRRMHNKSFTVDNAVSIVGGRNIADEYFQLTEAAVFADFDVLAVGPIAADILVSFDAYWNFSLAIPVDQLSSEVEAGTLEKERALIDAKISATYSRVYEEALQSRLLQDQIAGLQAGLIDAVDDVLRGGDRGGDEVAARSELRAAHIDRVLDAGERIAGEILGNPLDQFAVVWQRERSSHFEDLVAFG